MENVRHTHTHIPTHPLTHSLPHTAARPGPQPHRPQHPRGREQPTGGSRGGGPGGGWPGGRGLPPRSTHLRVRHLEPRGGKEASGPARRRLSQGRGAGSEFTGRLAEWCHFLRHCPEGRGQAGEWGPAARTGGPVRSGPVRSGLVWGKVWPLCLSVRVG